MYEDVDSIPTYEDLAPGENTYVLGGIVRKLGLPYEETSYIYEEADRYREPSKAYAKLLRLYLNFYLGTAKEMYGRDWKTIYDAIDDRNTEMKKKLALRSFCFTFPMHWKCKGQSWENGHEQWEIDEHPTLTGGKRRRKNKKTTKKRRGSRRHRTRRYR